MNAKEFKSIMARVNIKKTITVGDSQNNVYNFVSFNGNSYIYDTQVVKIFFDSFEVASNSTAIFFKGGDMVTMLDISVLVVVE